MPIPSWDRFSCRQMCYSLSELNMNIDVMYLILMNVPSLVVIFVWSPQCCVISNGRYHFSFIQYLQNNCTSHRGPFSAIAELIGETSCFGLCCSINRHWNSICFSVCFFKACCKFSMKFTWHLIKAQMFYDTNVLCIDLNSFRCIYLNPPEDNAYDPDVNAKQIWINKTQKKDIRVRAWRLVLYETHLV